MKKILIVGGYGIFGGRLAELLEGESTLSILIAGRSLEKATAFCAQRPSARANLVPVTFDRSGDIKAQLETLSPDIVVDASGPFQDYGRDAYALVQACIEQKIHYLDLADGADFVNGIGALDDAAKEAGVFILSGVSSFPVLTALVVRELFQDMERMDSILGGIAPSPYAGVGENVIRAIAGYAGQETAVKYNGQWKTAYPFTDSMRYTIAPPGYIPLRNILFSLVEVPDLRVVADLYPNTKTVWMGAGPVPEILHRALIGFAWLVRWKILPSLTPIVPLIRYVMNNFRWGEHRGGMFIEVQGLSKGQACRKSWHLLAEGRDGPFIPSMAIQAIIHKIINDEAIAPGARTAINDLDLDDYNRIFETKTIYTGFRGSDERYLPLYERILGSSYKSLPYVIQKMHRPGSKFCVRGRADVARGANRISNVIARLIGFPQEGANIPVSVLFNAVDGKEVWTRTFGEQSFSSVQFEGQGRYSNLLAERFGPLTFYMALVPKKEGKLRLVLRSWKAFGISLPMIFCPRSDSYETTQDGKFTFNVDITYPVIGRIVHYRGWLEPEGEFKS